MYRSIRISFSYGLCDKFILFFATVLSDYRNILFKNFGQIFHDIFSFFFFFERIYMEIIIFFKLFRFLHYYLYFYFYLYFISFHVFIFHVYHLSIRSLNVTLIIFVRLLCFRFSSIFI